MTDRKLKVIKPQRKTAGEEMNRGTTKQPETIEMAITYLLTITLTVNGLNSLIKRQRGIDGIKNKTHLHAAYKRLTSDLRGAVNEIETKRH